MTSKKIWFGNAEKMMWVNCPSTNIRRGRGRWEETGGYLNGGAYAVSSPYSHRKYSIDWNLMESAEAAKIMAFYEGVYGQSPIQFVDPFAAKSNILPLHWSVLLVQTSRRVPRRTTPSQTRRRGAPRFRCPRLQAARQFSCTFRPVTLCISVIVRRLPARRSTASP